MEIFNNTFIKIFTSLIGVAFIIYWISLLPLWEEIRKFISSLMGNKNLKSVDELIEDEKRKQIEEAAKRDNSEKL